MGQKNLGPKFQLELYSELDLAWFWDDFSFEVADFQLIITEWSWTDSFWREMGQKVNFHGCYTREQSSLRSGMLFLSQDSL